MPIILFAIVALMLAWIESIHLWYYIDLILKLLAYPIGFILFALVLGAYDN